MEPPATMGSLESDSVIPIGSELGVHTLFLTRSARRRWILRDWVVLKI